MLVFIVTLMSVGANLPDEIVASSGVDRKYLLAGLLIVVTIALVRYAKLVLVLAITILAVGANLPQEMAQTLNVDTRLLMFTLVAIVILSLANRLIKLPSGLEKPRKVVREHGSVALHKAIERRRIKIVGPIIDSGIDVDARSERGLTPLMMAAAMGYDELVQLLIDKGADLDAVNAKGQTALQIARLTGHQACVDALMVAVMAETTNTVIRIDSEIIAA